ncbi:MAG: DUF4340 domain-containing protein [Spirochaetales bacterium]|nr:DUF4340 domain-containing protein [Spirochaetales bacterium]
MAALSFQRKVLIMGVCIAVLTAAYVLGVVFSPARTGRREAEAPLIPGFNRRIREQVAEIHIAGEQGARKVVKRGDSWVLPAAERDFPASAARVDTFLDFLADMARRRVVTDNPEAWQEFEVQSDASRRIQLLDSAGDVLSEIIVGKTAAGGADNYVRVGNGNEVLLADRSFDYYLNPEEKFWAHLRIFPDDLEGQSIMRITVDSTLRFEEEAEGQDLKYTLVLSSEQPAVWNVVDLPEGELDNQKVDLLASNLADLEGTEFAHGVGPVEAGLENPAASILISTEDGRDFRLFIGGEAGGDQYYAALEDGQLIYKVAEWRVKGLLKDIGQLRAEPD